MIDTLRLNLIDCEIKRSCPLSIQPGVIDYSTGLIHNDNDLFIDNTGKIVRGSKAYLNDDKFNLTIQPTVESEMNDFNRTKLKVKRFKRINEAIQPDLYDWNDEDDEVKGIFIQTSLPRLLNETNLKTLSYDEQQTALKNLESKLKEYGIKTNINNAILSRVDTFTNIKTEFPFFNYARLFSLMELSRMKSVGYGNESFLWKNGNQELMIYDKIREMAEKNNNWFLNERKKALGFKNKNIMRIENRLLKKRKIISSLTFKTVGELYNNYDELKDFHINEVEKKIFKFTLNDIEGMTKNVLEAQLYFCKQQFNDKWLDGFLKMEGMKSFLKTGDENFLFQIIEKLDNNKSDVALRKKKSRLKKMFNEMKFYIGIFETKFKEGIFKTNSELYNELKTKFYKEVA